MPGGSADRPRSEGTLVKKLLVLAMTTASLTVLAPAASASCTVVIDGTGCIENAVCGAVDKAKQVDCVE